jgi:hypothetical protein
MQDSQFGRREMTSNAVELLPEVRAQWLANLGKIVSWQPARG